MTEHGGATVSNEFHETLECKTVKPMHMEELCKPS